MTSILDEFRELPDFSAFEAFAQALWDNEAAVMVGSGFSRVCTREADAPMPPLWGDFAANMKSALGYAPDRGPDALRLAQEYQAQHGQDGLDRLIRQLVTDEQWEPSNLHKQLVELPWRDILTTNWDTLLERTSPKTPDRIYGCVRTVEDIARVRAPRVVKLHGSLPSHAPLIFTEDDFRTYPTQFAPFVNLAQQVMLENELCLLGFSGVDPNFLAWSGWVRDTLSISARRIRLIGVLNLKPAARTLLEQRNVTPIDLWPLVKDLHPSQQHEKALELLFAALIEAKPPTPFEWVLGTDRFNASPSSAEEDKATRREVAEAWGTDRFTYPGWIIAPNNTTWRLRSSFPTVKKADEKPKEHLRFAYERIWRHETAGGWLHRADLTEADSYYHDAEAELSPQEQTELCSIAASYWRIFRQWDHWSRWMARLAAIAGNEARLCHTYETGLKAILEWDDAAVKTAADSLVSDMPIWMMRRAGLLSTIFEYRSAAELYQSALLEVRRKLRAAPKSAWLISLEGWSALCHKVTYSALTDDFYSFPEKDSDETRLRYIAAKADPWEEISRRDSLAFERADRNRTDKTEWKLAFQPGRFRSGRVRRLGDDAECPFYGLIALMEKTGAPERGVRSNLFSDRLIAAYRALKDPDEDDLVTLLTRYRGTDFKFLDDILPRRRVAQMNEETLAVIRDGVMKRIELMQTSAIDQRRDDHLRFLLALLARVVIRVDSIKALEVFEWILNILVSPSAFWTSYEHYGDVLKNAIQAMSENNRQAAIKLSLDLKLPSEAGVGGIERDWPELIDEFSSDEIRDFSVSDATSLRIGQFIEVFRAGDTLNRTRAFTRLHRLYKAEKLTDLQTAEFEQAIWNRCSDVGWPIDTDLYPWVYLETPGQLRAEELFLSTFVDKVSEGNVTKYLLHNLRAGMPKLSKPIESRTIIKCIEACLKWQPEPIEESTVDPFFNDGANNDEEIAKEIGYTLAHTLLPVLMPENITAELATTIRAIPEQKHIPTLSAVAFQIGRLLPKVKFDGAAIIRAAIASRDPQRVYPTFIAIKQQINAISQDEPFPREIAELLLHMVEQRLQPGLGSAMKFIGDLILAEALSHDNIARLATALPEIIEEYRYDQDRLSVPSLAEMPEVRRQACRLINLIVGEVPELDALKVELEADPLPEIRSL
ncbi:MAG: SIR2 family protein [Hyphomicrobiales bacterium]